ncbi:MAG: lipoate--protein ligase family protein [Actinomycetota bacterium]|nr:lipoate--protein ligase family protein [Actinomycetota bacterium]
MLFSAVEGVVWVRHPEGAAAQESLDIDEGLLASHIPSASLRVNAPVVSVGFNQDAAAEVDLALASELGIPVVRRRTGGGAVYRDGGCVSWAFTAPLGNPEDAVEIVRECVADLGVDLVRTGRNDLFWNGRKVSGFAWTRQDDWMLVHGSLLFSTDLDLMARLLDCGKAKYRGTAIASVRQRVANLQDALPGLDVEGFRQALETGIARRVAPSDVADAEAPGGILLLASRRSEIRFQHDERSGL